MSAERRCATSSVKSASGTPRSGRHRPVQLKAKYGGLSTSNLQRLKDLEAEDARLKKMYANLSLVHDALKDTVEKSSKRRREAGLV